VFSELIRLEFPLETEEGTSDTITTMEKKIINMVQAMFEEKFLKSTHCKISNKQCMIQCLLDISSNTGDDLDCEDMVNRGGLWQINEDVYSVFIYDGRTNPSNS